MSKEKRGTTERHLFGDAGEPIEAVNNSQSQFWRRGVDANAKFAELMVAAGYRAEVKGPQGDNPTFMAPGTASPCVRSNADF